jgi:uncharacterized protein DUF1329
VSSSKISRDVLLICEHRRWEAARMPKTAPPDWYVRFIRIAFRTVVLICVFATRALAADNAAPSPAIAAAATATASENSASQIPPGTKITLQNWQQYRQFMPDGMIDLFAGKYIWKMPADVEMDVGPTVIHPLPAGYLAATEKNRGKTTLVELPDGGMTVANYEGGSPFPDPAEPYKGWKILANFWFRYFPHFVVNDSGNLGFMCTMDSFGSVNCVKGRWVYRQHSFNTDPGVPATIPGGEGKYYTTWFMTEEPEQARYSANLLIAYTDLTKPQATFVFKPALRRAEQLSAVARCSSSGSDTTPDDGFFAFDGDIPEFDANLLGERSILDQMDVGTAGANLPADYDMPLGWPKPTWGKWEVRDTYMLDIRKIPAKAAGYCYGKRIMYLDKQFYGALWEDLFDMQMRPWKIALLQPIVIDVPGIGPQNSSGAQYSHFWNIQSKHATFSGPNDGHGYTVLINDAAPKEYENIEKYTTPGGLNQIMR